MTLNTFIQANPKISIIIFSLGVTIFMTIIRYFFTDRKAMREIKEKQKTIREEMKKHKDNPEKIMELNKQMMEHFPIQMKQSFKLMLITIVPMLLLLGWLRSTFTEILPHWIWWYIIPSLIFGIVLGKIFKLD